MKKYVVEVEAALRAINPTEKPSRWLAKNYIGGKDSKLGFLDIKIPYVRALYKKGFSFSKLPPEEQWKIWDYVWHNSNLFEAMLLSSFWASKRSVEELHENRELVVDWVARVDNWAHSDELSSHMAKLFEFNSKAMLPIFKKWSVSKNPWLKRQALVGLFYYSRMRKKKPSFQVAIEFVKAHIDDDHYYVQKGVGWTLRELWNVYPKETYAFLAKNAKKIPPAGWTAATEKLSAADKAKLLKIRREKSR